MKKFLAVLLSLMLLLGLTVANAEDALLEMNWSDVEAQVAESGLSGDFVVFEEYGFKLWLPEGFAAAEVDAEDAEEGCIAVYTTEDEAYSIVLGVYALEDTYVADADMSNTDDIKAALEDAGYYEIDFAKINGLLACTFMVPDYDSLNVGFFVESGYCIEINFEPASDDDFVDLASIIMLSLQTI